MNGNKKIIIFKLSDLFFINNKSSHYCYSYLLFLIKGIFVKRGKPNYTAALGCMRRCPTAAHTKIQRRTKSIPFMFIIKNKCLCII